MVFYECVVTAKNTTRKWERPSYAGIHEESPLPIIIKRDDVVVAVIVTNISYALQTSIGFVQ